MEAREGRKKGVGKRVCREEGKDNLCRKNNCTKEKRRATNGVGQETRLDLKK